MEVEQVPNDIYTENDVKENIDAGNVYIKPNIRGVLELVNDYEFKSLTDQRYDITAGTLTCIVDLNFSETESFITFKDGSYIKVVLSPTWVQDDVWNATTIAWSWYFGLMDETTGTVTEYIMNSGTVPPLEKPFFVKSYDPIQGTVWIARDPIHYFPGDKFKFALGWWEAATPKLRSLFYPYTVSGTYSAADYYNELNPNILSGGAQSGISLTSETGQLFAAYLCGYSTEGTKYPGEDSETGGGAGTFYNRNDAIGLPAIPELQAIDLGFTTLYNPHAADVRALASWLWSDDFTDNIKMNYADPLNNILGINFIALPDGIINNERAEFVIGNCNSHIETMKVSTGNSNQYVVLDCGNVNIPEYWQNFLDYDTQFSIWLPYIGFRSLRADDVLQATEENGGYLNVTYYIDLLTGCAVCHLICKIEDNATHEMIEHLLYSFNCNVFYSTPISGANYTAMYNQQLNAVSSGINTVVSAAGQAMQGNVMGAIGSIATLITGGAQSKMAYDTAKPDYGRSGNNGGNTGYFSYKKPYIVRTQAIGQTPKNYKELQGIPSQLYRKLSDLEGYTEIDRVITDTLVSCTAEEKEEIITLLKRGVVL